MPLPELDGAVPAPAAVAPLFPPPPAEMERRPLADDSVPHRLSVTSGPAIGAPETIMVSARRTRIRPSPLTPSEVFWASTWIIHADTHCRGYLGSLLCGKLTEILVFGFIPTHPTYPINRHPSNSLSLSLPAFSLSPPLTTSHCALESGSCEETASTTQDDALKLPRCIHIIFTLTGVMKYFSQEFLHESGTFFDKCFKLPNYEI